MKKRKLVIRMVVMLVVVLMSQSVIAQPGAEHRRENDKERMTKMTKELGLSKAQVKKIEAINAKYDKKRRSGEQGKERGDREAMKNLRTAHLKEVEKVLTKEQRVKAKAMVEKRGRGMRKHPENRE